jgi:hypothetical protein
MVRISFWKQFNYFIQVVTNSGDSFEKSKIIAGITSCTDKQTNIPVVFVEDYFKFVYAPMYKNLKQSHEKKHHD